MCDDIAILINSMAIHNCDASYNRLFKLLFNPLTRFAMCFLKSKSLAEEVASDVMFMLWQKRKDLIFIINVRSYAFIAAKNLSLYIIKRNNNKEFISIDDMDVNIKFDVLTPEQLLISSELRKKLETAINTLPPKGKLVFKLIKEEGFSYKEVAETLNISIKTVDAHLVASIKKLSLVLKDEFNLV